MIYFILYLLLVLLLLAFLILMSVYTLSLIYSSIKGSPYVATRKKRVEEILKDANLKKGEIFYELGSGDGRISRLAAKKYGVRSVGIDVNPILVFWSNFLTKMHGLDDCKFIKMNIFDFDFSKADYLYIFLMPVLIDKLIPKLKKELKKGTLIISHGFKVKDKKIKLVKTTEAKMFNTYYYRI